MNEERSEEEVLEEMKRLDDRKREARFRAAKGTTAGQMIGSDPSLNRLEAMIETAPETRPEPPKPKPIDPASLDLPDDFPRRYRLAWERPTDQDWNSKLSKLVTAMKSGGIVAILGCRGTGKTRLAAEAARNYAPKGVRYSTALELFLAVRATFKDGSKESEIDVVNRFRKARLLILDEIQERGETEFEDRILTAVIDGRYLSEKPTILIANQDKKQLTDNLGTSIVSRIAEGGGTMTLDGHDWRTHPEKR